MSQPQLVPSKRSQIRSFKVMDVVAKADRLARSGRDIVHLEVGQPQSSAPQASIRLAQEQLGADRCGYTAARGEPPLRDAIAGMYEKTYGVKGVAERIHLTPGSSGAFTIAFMAAFDVGDAVAVPSSSYPCYRNLLRTYGCDVVSVAVNAEYNLTAVELAAAQKARAASGLPALKGLILSSPANPTGAMLSPDELKGLCELCDKTGVQFISDELCVSRAVPFITCIPSIALLSSVKSHKSLPTPASRFLLRILHVACTAATTASHTPVPRVRHALLSSRPTCSSSMALARPTQ